MEEVKKTVEERSKEILVRQMKVFLSSKVVKLFDDPEVIEIIANANSKLIVERFRKGLEIFCDISASDVSGVIKLMAAHLGTVVTEKNPIVEGAMPDLIFKKSRFAGALPKISEVPTFCIRIPSAKVFSLEDYLEQEIITQDQYDKIVKAIHDRRNILISGGTGSGKTTFLNAIADYVSKNLAMQRIVVIEDTKEIRCDGAFNEYLITDEDNDIDMTRLLKLTLRYRPDRIFVGEVRDKAALALLKAWNTGHPGGLATIHANDCDLALTRLDQLCQEANVPSQRELISDTVDVVIQIAKDNSAKSGRKVSEIRFFHE